MSNYQSFKTNEYCVECRGSWCGIDPAGCGFWTCPVCGEINSPDDNTCLCADEAGDLKYRLNKEG